MVLSDKIAIMRDGVLQQYSTPDETYNEPVNTFVAGFIGNPRMNFLKGTLTPSNGGVVLDSEDLTLRLEGDRARAVAGSGRQVMVGIRPEQIAVVPPGSGAATATVELIEAVGPVTYVDMTLGTRSLRASVGGSQRYDSGESIGIEFQTDAIHFFDGETGTRISA